MRYQFYREHKYVSAALNDLERLIAKTDFRVDDELKQVESAFDALAEMLQGHAHYENERLHALLKQKHSNVFAHAEADHAEQDEQLANLREQLTAIREGERVERGYRFYLAYRKFVGDNLAHLHEEETVILPELQRLYTDQELRDVERATYQQMTMDEMIHMIETLFPHMNPSDRDAFLTDIRILAPEKFQKLTLS